MPSLTTTILTSAVTLTSFVTVTTAAAMAPPSIFEQVEKLGQCSQSVIFECLSVSTCNPTDFPCICQELSHLGIESKVTAACPTETDAYLKFAADVCAQPLPASSSAIVYPTYPVVNPSSIVYPSYPVYTPAPQNVTSSVPAPSPSPSPAPYPSSQPANNSTTPSPGPGPAPGPQTSGDVTSTIKLTTVVTQIVTTGPGGQPTTITSQIVTPVPSGSGTTPVSPEFTGAASALNIKNAAVAGLVGFMGYVFAAL